MDDIVSVLPIVDRVARDARFTHGVDEDEAYGVLALEVVARARDYLILHTSGQDGLIEKRLKGEIAMYARVERVKRVHETDQYFYDPEYVRLFLPFFYSYEDWPNGPINDDTAAEYRTTEAMDTAIDIRGAWPRLKDRQARIVNERHLSAPTEDGAVDWDRIAELLGLKDGHSARNTYAAATRELTVEMNSARTYRTSNHQGPGAREAVSNTRAAALLS
jgi:hypothetical protein